MDVRQAHKGKGFPHDWHLTKDSFTTDDVLRTCVRHSGTDTGHQTENTNAHLELLNTIQQAHLDNFPWRGLQLAGLSSRIQPLISILLFTTNHNTTQHHSGAARARRCRPHAAAAHSLGRAPACHAWRVPLRVPDGGGQGSEFIDK
jgi:hypothetical protein